MDAVYIIQSIMWCQVALASFQEDLRHGLALLHLLLGRLLSSWSGFIAVVADCRLCKGEMGSTNATTAFTFHHSQILSWDVITSLRLWMRSAVMFNVNFIDIAALIFLRTTVLYATFWSCDASYSLILLPRWGILRVRSAGYPAALCEADTQLERLHRDIARWW